MTRFDFFESKNIGFSNRDNMADWGSPRRMWKPHGWETAEKPSSPPTEQATNSG
jgi:hypothetical protein